MSDRRRVTLLVTLNALFVFAVLACNYIHLRRNVDISLFSGKFLAPCRCTCPPCHVRPDTQKADIEKMDVEGLAAREKALVEEKLRLRAEHRYVRDALESKTKSQKPPQEKSPGSIFNALGDPDTRSARARKFMVEAGFEGLDSNASKLNRTGLGAVTYLVKNSEKVLRDLYNSLAHLSDNFCRQQSMGKYYPILLFSDGCVDELTRSLLQNVAKHCQIKFETVPSSFAKMPDFIPANVTEHFHKYGKHGRGLGYGLMIRWNMRTLFEHPAVQSVDFIMRMDTDSSILTPMKFDPFLAMSVQKPRKKYAYFCSSFEGPEWRHGLHDFVSNYMLEKHIVSPWDKFNPDEGDPVVMPYNNIEIVDVDWWLSEPVQQFVDAVDRSLGIWHHRWGDAPIRGMAISLFLREDELFHLQNFRYSHPWHRELEPLRFEYANWTEELEARKHEFDASNFVGMCRKKPTHYVDTMFKSGDPGKTLKFVYQRPDCPMAPQRLSWIWQPGKAPPDRETHAKEFQDRMRKALENLSPTSKRPSDFAVNGVQGKN